MFDIQLKLAALTVPTNLPHKTRPEEIAELPSFLAVNMSGARTKSIINFGSTTPAPEDSGYPWLKLNANGTAAGWYTFVNGLWIAVGTQMNVPPDYPLSVTPAGLIDVDSSIPYAPLVTIKGGVPPYSIQQVIPGTGTMNYTVAGVNSELIYPSGLTAGTYTLIITDSEKSSMLPVNFRIDAAPGTGLSYSPTPAYLAAILNATRAVTISGGTPPYHLVSFTFPNGIVMQPSMISVAASGTNGETLTFTQNMPTGELASFFSGGTGPKVLIADSGVNTMTFTLVITTT